MDKRRNDTRYAEGSRGRIAEQNKRRKTAKVEKRRKAPLLLRVLSWSGVILLCFVGGYAGTSWMMSFLNKSILLKPDNRIESSQDLKVLNEKKAANVEMPQLSTDKKTGLKQVGLTLYHPGNGKLLEYPYKAVAGVQEDNINDAVLKLLSLSGPGVADKQISIRHVFRKGDTVYLDFSDSFAVALSALGQKGSALLITGIVRTMRDNFQPIEKVRFLINSKVTSSGAPVDLTAIWQLPK